LSTTNVLGAQEPTRLSNQPHGAAKYEKLIRLSPF
jgi:hypothetical protein